MADENEEIYVFSEAAVLRSLDRLQSQSIHEHFSGYLAILRAGAAHPNDPIRVPDIKEFHNRYLLVKGAPKRMPFVRPFKSRGHGIELFNPNVSGSYSPASMRPGRPIADVVEAVGSGREASLRLRDNHANVAFERLLKSEKVPVGALACFLYRDYGFHLDRPDVAEVISIFREEFAMSRAVVNQNLNFKLLFEDDSSEFADADLVKLNHGNSDHA